MPDQAVLDPREAFRRAVRRGTSRRAEIELFAPFGGNPPPTARLGRWVPRLVGRGSLPSASRLVAYAAGVPWHRVRVFAPGSIPGEPDGIIAVALARTPAYLAVIRFRFLTEDERCTGP